jgi:hypothetical protein
LSRFAILADGRLQTAKARDWLSVNISIKVGHGVKTRTNKKKTSFQNSKIKHSQLSKKHKKSRKSCIFRLISFQ